jgi:DNA topoisomerase-2
MASNYVGSNNINLLMPNGQFGTRLQGGKDFASARYIFTNLNEITRYIFREEDDDVLEYLDDDGFSIEPKYYVPIIPMILVNGAEGIGTGWSTNIPNYNPLDIIENIQRIIKGEEPIDMIPWYQGFTGEICFDTKKKKDWKSIGKIEKVTDTILFISELPISTWTQDYKVNY